MSLVLPLVFLPLLGLAGAFFALAFRAKRRSLKFLQGPPSPSLLFGNERELSSPRKVGSLEDDWFGEYGTAFRMAGCYGEDILMLSDPKGLQHIFHKSAYRYPKPKDIEHISRKLFGPGLTVVQGETHQRQRKLLNPVFSAAQVKPFAEVFNSCIQTLVRKWQGEIVARESPGQPATVIDAVRWLPHMALDALGESLFEYEFGALEGTRISTLCDIIRDLFIDSRSLTRFRLLRRAANRFLPTPISKLMDLRKTKEDKRFEHWLKTSRNIADELVKLKIEDSGTEGKNDFMSVLSRALDATVSEKGMSPVESLSQMATFIFAGHETSANTLSWILYELGKHPKEQEILFQEIKNVRQKTGNDGDPLLVKDLEGMAHLNQVIKETLRFHPIVSELFRQADVDDVIPLDHPVVDASGSVLTQIPVAKGQRVHISVHSYNRNKQLWGGDAEEWNPNRFTNNNKPTTLGMFGNLMTFSGGVRGCIGWRFALLEIQVVLAVLVESFTFSIPDGVEMEQVSPGLGSPLMKGRWAEGAQMPLKIALRTGTV